MYSFKHISKVKGKNTYYITDYLGSSRRSTNYRNLEEGNVQDSAHLLFLCFLHNEEEDRQTLAAAANFLIKEKKEAEVEMKNTWPS